MGALIDFPDYSIDFNRALAAIPEHIVGQHGVPDLTDPMATYRYLEKRRQVIVDSTRQRPLIRLWDKNMKFVAQIAQERSVMVEELMTDAGAGNIVIRRDNWLSDFLLYDKRVEEDVHVTVDPIPTAPDWRTRWGGKVIGINAKRDSDGLHTVELQMISNREHYKHILAGANPIFPPEIQIPKMWILPWNCRTALMITLFINLARQFFPFLSIPTNIVNPGAWIGPGVLQGLDVLSWPIQPQYINPLVDQSRFTIVTSRWTDMHTISAPLLEDAGCQVRAYTWLTEDKTSPHPELHLGLKELPFVGPLLQEISDTTGLPTDLDELVRPHRNAVILACEDKSGTTGPTGCVSADTVIEGPDGDERIDMLAKRGGSFRVWSRTPSGERVAATAAFAFKKGRAELFEFALADGRSIKATADHRFLTEKGWVRGGTLHMGNRIATTDRGFMSLVDIMSLGVDEYYDMTVPVLENYAAQGIWNHNTLLDGVIKLAAATADDLITETVFPVDKDADGVTDPFFRALTLTAPEKPWVVFRDDEYSGIVESNRSLHACTAKTIMVGSKSPGWVNQSLSFGIKYVLAQLSELIYSASGLAVAGFQAPGTPGLEELYQGQLDDCCAPTTFVDGPDGSHQIGKLAEYGGPFRVWSITPWGKRVPATAVFAFKKGRAEQFEYTLANGRSITVTGDHRFLTDHGYVRAHSIVVGSKIATIDGGFSPVVDIQFVGVDDYYDMHVPGWENYAAEGMWNHNTLAAWQRYTDIKRALRMGDFGYLEHFEQGSGSAYTISAVLDLRTGHWKTRPYISFTVTVRNGAPYIAGVDFQLGDRLAFEMGNVLHVDQCTGIRYSYDDSSPVKTELVIGHGNEEEDPVAKATRALAAIWNNFGLLLGSGDMF